MMYIAVDWYDKNEQGEPIAVGTTMFCGTAVECKAKWDKIVTEHDACFLRTESKQEWDAFCNRYYME